MGKASGQTNMANSFQNQVSAPGVSTPNVQQRVGRPNIGAHTQMGSPTQLPAEMEGRVKDWWDKKAEGGGSGPFNRPSPAQGLGIAPPMPQMQERFAQARDNFRGGNTPMPGQFGEMMQQARSQFSPSTRGAQSFPGLGGGNVNSMLSRALRGRDEQG